MCAEVLHFLTKGLGQGRRQAVSVPNCHQHLLQEPQTTNVQCFTACERLSTTWVLGMLEVALTHSTSSSALHDDVTTGPPHLEHGGLHRVGVQAGVGSLKGGDGMVPLEGRRGQVTLKLEYVGLGPHPVQFVFDALYGLE